MGKKLFSLCMALALCLGLLPVTALAAENAPATLIVGGTNVIGGGSWTTSDGKLSEYTNSSDAWNVNYDTSNNTLTLKDADITGATIDEISNLSVGIYASGSSEDVSLNIILQGDNNQVSGVSGIYVFSDSGDASLSISGTGSLTAEGTGYGNYSGIMVQSNGGKAELTINNVDVTATNSNTQGIRLQPAGTSPATLAVNGGSLTASGSKGIDYQFGTGTTGSGTPTVTVSNNAIVRANGSISNNSSTEIQIDADSSASSGGIVFDDNEGTVYGDVTLQEDLTIGEGESLTIGDGASLTTDGKLTVNGGTLNGTPNGDVTYKVTGVSLNKDSLTLDVGASDTLTATITPDKSTNKNVTWSSDNENVVTVENGKVTAVGTGSATITVTTEDGGKTATCSVTVNAPATTITTQPSNVTVTEGETATFSVAATGSGTLTYQWQQSTDNGSTWTDISGATSSSYTTQAATTDMNGYQYRCKVTGTGGEATSNAATLTVTAATVPVTGVTLNKTSTSLYVGDTETLTPSITPDNATNKNLTWSSDDTSVATVDASGLVTAVSAGTATITVTTEDGAKTATCTVTVSRYSSGGGSSSSSTSLSDRAIDDIQDARPGDTVEITLRPGRTTLEREVFEELAGQDITLEIDAGDGVLWAVNGLDIPEDTRLHDLDLDVDLGDSDIPATVLNAVTGEIGTVQLSLAHDGQFGFTMTLSAPLGRDNTDYWANLYWYNERTEELEFQQADRIARDGTAEFALDHASDYAIVIDDRSHEPVDLPFADVPESYWAYDAIQYVYGEGLMAGTSGSTFSPEGTTTRGQIVTILWRLSGSPVVNYLMDFDDVDPAAYYAEAIRWATSEGIAGGYGGGVFGPDDPITREQLAVMLHRYAQHEGCDVSIGEDTNILSYADFADLSEYAIPAMQWACGAGLISGTGDGSTLTPQGEATRAQAATVLMRFCEQSIQ